MIELYIYKNGAQYASTSRTPIANESFAAVQIADLVELESGQYIDLQARSNVSGALYADGLSTRVAVEMIEDA